jgi:nucleoside-diphosphate-sugar epimerase
MAEQLFGDWAARAPAGSLTVVRPTVVFGPSNQHNVHTLLAQIAHGRSIVIGDRRNRKSLACVGNVADFLVHALSFPPGVAVDNYAEKPRCGHEPAGNPCLPSAEFGTHAANPPSESSSALA